MLSFLGECLRFAFCLAITLWFLVMIIQAVRAGKVRNKFSSSFWTIRRQPVMFLLSCFAYFLFASVFGYSSVRAWRDLWSAWLLWA
ncbi:MAG: hypothetical protein BGO12_05680 [Verrucomicrobia bacterium 61-8]|nr:MAG: hypothetical protein BGO12_05680 [Verrucomicrobia bacterium 61-8]